jgi:hypothetical protein
MRRFILISALLLASATAHAGQPRGLVLASNDEPKSERIEAVKSEDTSAPVASAPAATKAAAPAPVASEPTASKSVVSKSVASRPSKKTHESYDDDEAKARRIAARYGISW